MEPDGDGMPGVSAAAPGLVETPQTRMNGGFPRPAKERWHPLRCGLINLYRYDYEEFHFEDGRLLLRGNNGSGKSRVLALQLPFLLDGEVSPARIEPDGDPAKRIEWNLLMGRYPDRTGYTWIEFGRRDEDGSTRFLTLGCGLRAVAGHSGLHSRWFFITPQRIGRESLHLDEEAHVLIDAGEWFEHFESGNRRVRVTALPNRQHHHLHLRLGQLLKPLAHAGRGRRLICGP